MELTHFIAHHIIFTEFTVEKRVEIFRNAFWEKKKTKLDAIVHCHTTQQTDNKEN